MPILRDWLTSHGVIPHDDYRAFRRAVAAGKVVGLYPGGPPESLFRDYTAHPYQLRWQERTGFLKLAIKFQLPIVFTAAIGIEEMLFQGETKLPQPLFKLIRQIIDPKQPDQYKQIKMLWGHNAHLPVKVTHIITEPFELYKTITEEDIKNPHFVAKKLQWLEQQCQKRLDTHVGQRENYSDTLDQFTLSSVSFLRSLGV